MKLPAFVLVIVAVTVRLQGAPPSAGSRTVERDPSAPIRLILKTNQVFTATGLVSVTPPSPQKAYKVEVAYAWRNGNFRAELDQPKANNSPGAASFGRGLNWVAYITTTDVPVTWILYPSLHGFIEKDDPLLDYRKTPRIEKTDLGTETVNDHPCTKRNVIVTAPTGASSSFIVWEASDLSELPVAVLFVKDENTIKVTLGNISTNLPDAKLFRLPENAKRYESQDEVMTAYVIQMLREMKGIPLPSVPSVPQTDNK
jgi:hypothetical protein